MDAAPIALDARFRLSVPCVTRSRVANPRAVWGEESGGARSEPGCGRDPSLRAGHETRSAELHLLGLMR